ncbi:MAG: hypothetical protein NC311_08870 [Muribaculaceae bacterium]|nr:hypothetical protein [Muribaculaceae bacterium]
MIIEQIQQELGPHYTTLMDAIGWPVWTAEWRIDLTDEARYYVGKDAEQRAIKRALQEGYMEWNERN